MKRILSLVLSLTLAITLSACASHAGQSGIGSDPVPGGDVPGSDVTETPPADQSGDSVPPENGVPAEPDGSGKKILIAYFSATNNTESIANHLYDILNADLYEIVPETPYTSDDLNYSDSLSRSSQEMNDPDARPGISGSVDNMEQYDVILLGYPIWWGEAPKIIHTFLTGYDLSGKIIAPFCTSASSPIGSSAAALQDLTDGAEWLTGQRFGGGASAEEVQSWVDSLNLDE